MDKIPASEYGNMLRGQPHLHDIVSREIMGRFTKGNKAARTLPFAEMLYLS